MVSDLHGQLLILLRISCYFQDSFLVDDFQYFESDVFRYESPWVILLGIYWASWLNIFHQNWEIFGYYLFQCSLCPFLSLFSSKFPIMPVLVFWMVSHRTLGLFIFLHSFCSSSTSSNLLLSPSSEFFIAVIVLFNSRVSIWFYFYTFYFLFLSHGIS